MLRRHGKKCVLLIPLLTEFFLRKFGVIEVHSVVDFLQISADFLAVLVRYELAAVADLVDYTELIALYFHRAVFRILVRLCESGRS